MFTMGIPFEVLRAVSPMLISRGLLMLCALCVPLFVTPSQAEMAIDCTLYAAPNGNDGNNGTSPSMPRTLVGAANAAGPGSVVCLKGGTYTLTSSLYFGTSGTPSAWIVYKPYGDGPVDIVASTSWDPGPGGDELTMFAFWSGSVWRDGYTEFRDLNFDGQNIASVALSCTRTHHLRFIGNTITNQGSSGISTKYCDYIVADRNQITHSGYNQGWGSGISYNSSQWYDNAPGFHQLVINNIISGMYDASGYHVDGHGIIMDLSNNSYDYSTANTPPALVANNVVFENGGSCVLNYVTTNIWVVNNTCYSNTLDTGSVFSEIGPSNSNWTYFINNLVYGWNTAHYAYFKSNASADISYYKDFHFNSKGLNFDPLDPSQFILGDPRFVNAPPVDASAPGQYATALPPSALGNALHLGPDSPAIDSGVNPTTVPPVVRRPDGSTFTDTAITAGLQQYVSADIEGVSRPTGAGWDVGAYEYAFATADTSPPSVSITAPSSGATVHGVAAVSADASDNVAVTGVQFKLDGANLGAEDLVAPYSVSWNTTSSMAGTHALTAVARDAAGNSTTSAAVSITVDNQAPIISAVSVSGITASSATISWTTDELSDSQVEYGLSISYGQSTTPNAALVAAHSVGVTGLAANTLYHYRVKSKDASGNVASSGDLTFTTAPGADTTRPVVSITAPAAGATVSGSAVTVSASASDNVAVVGVQFKLDGANLGTEDLVAPYSVSWNTTSSAAGTHVLTAVARDAAGNSTTSAAVSIIVDNQAPIISAVSVSGITASSATISWTTNEPSDSQVEYGLSTAYGQSTTLNTALVTAHSVSLKGLSKNTVYHYRVKSRNARGNGAISGDFTFRTNRK